VSALPFRTDSLMFAVHEREMDEARDFEDAAEAAGCALSAKLEALLSKPQHAQDRELVELVRDIYTGNAYGRSRLFALLEQVAQDVDPRPSEMLIRWHGGRP
jgi:ubiquinone biosynthesis protein UbiJ